MKFTAFFFVAIFLFFSLITYFQYDISLNVDSEILIPYNMLGIVGAYVADILMQFFGNFSFLFVLFFLNWSVTVIKYGYIDNIAQKILLSIVDVAFLCIALSFHFDLDVGCWKLVSNIPYLKEYHYIFAMLFFISFLFLLFFILGYPLEEYKLIWNLINKKLAVLKFVKKDEYSQLKINSKLRVDPHAKSSHKNTETITNIEIEPTISFDTTLYNTKLMEFVDVPDDIESKRGNKSSSLFELPSLDLLNVTDKSKLILESEEQLNENAEVLLRVLGDFGVKGNIININQGPVVTLYEFEPAAGTKSSRVIGLSDDIARSLSALSTRIAVIPGRNVLGIELPNEHRQFFRLRELFSSSVYNDRKVQLPIVLGKDLSGEPYVVDLAKMPHLLVAGTTGSGKSVAINAMILSLLYRHTPDECRLIMIDPKMLELSVYDDIPHLLCPVVTEPSKAIIALKWAVKEMENRYRLMSNLGVRNINGYNDRIDEVLVKGETLNRTVQTGFDPNTGKAVYESIPIDMVKLPFIVIIVDEMADLMLVAGKDIEASIQRLAQMARAAGIHIIMATQRPSVDVITGVIKANFPSRISFRVTSRIDSRTILGEQGAEQLLGMGDMLYMGSTSKIIRVHGPFVDDREVENVTRFLKLQGMPDYVTSVTEAPDEDDIATNSLVDDSSDDGLYNQAVAIIRRDKKVSTSYVQRCLRIGYNRAAILIERMESEGIITPPNHTGKRELID